MRNYESELSARLDPTAAGLHLIFEKLHANPRRVVFAEGEEERVIRAALAYRNAGYGTPVLIGREERILQTLKAGGLGDIDGLEIHNARLSNRNAQYTEFLYRRMQRSGLLFRDCQRLVNQDRNVFAACMVVQGDADAMVTGITRSFYDALEDVTRVIDPRPNEQLFGLSMVFAKGRTVFIADTSVNELPTPEQLADIAAQSAAAARRIGHEPRVALLSFSNFGNPLREKAERIREAVAVLDGRKVDFEYEGEMQADVALDFELMRRLYPFSRLKGPANILVMPALHSANISAKLMQQLGGTVIGPVLMGLSKPAQIVPAGASVSDLLTAAALAGLAAVR
jgi:malate dehydrogenase (oxaloacetate-decarboxylating)(NADP+)